MEFSRARPENFSSGLPALQQSDQYGRAVAELGARTEKIYASEGHRPIASMQVIRRRFGPMNIAWLPRGPVWASDITSSQKGQVLRQLRSALPERATWIVAPDDMQDKMHFRHTPLMSPQHVAEIDLRLSPDRLLTAQHGKWRNRLRHAQNAGLRVTHRLFKPARDMDLLAQEEAQRNSRGYSALPPEFVLAWAKMNPADSRLFTVWRESTALAHLLVLLHIPVASYHIGWTSPVGRRSSAHNLGLWEASNWLIKKGYQRFDLGVIDTRNAPGLARFKIGCGAQVRPLGPTCLYLPQHGFGRLARHAAA